MADNPRDFNKWVKSVERRLNQAIRSGQSATAVNLARDVQNVRDQIGSIEVGAGRQPAAPVEIVVQTAIHTDSAGQKFGSVSATFPPVTMGMDAQPIDVDRYELWVRDEDATIGDPDGEVARPNLITNPPSELQVSSGERERFFNDLTLGQHFEAGDELEFTVSAITSTNYNLANGADMSRHRINFTGLPEQEGSEDIGQSNEGFNSSHLPTFQTGSDWQDISIRVTVPEGYTTLRPSIRTAHNGGWIMFDNIRVVNLSHEPPGAQRRGMELVTTSASTSLQFDGATPGRRYEVGVRAVAHGSPSPMSRLRSVTVERDTTPPPIPSPLSLSSSGATVTATWDSLAATGDEMPVDFSFTEMAYGPAPDQVSQVSASLTLLFTSYIFETPPIPDDENYDGTWYFRHRAVDTSGNRSAWSPLTQIVPKRLIDEAAIRFELEEFNRERIVPLESSINDEVRKAQDAIQSFRDEWDENWDSEAMGRLEARQDSLQSDLSTGLSDVRAQAEAIAEEARDNAVSQAAANAQSEYDLLQAAADAAQAKADQVASDLGDTSKEAQQARAEAAAAASTAQQALVSAQDAHTAAGNAADLAASAHESASSKSTIHWSLSAPSGTADSTDDVWWQYELRNNRRVVVGQWFWDSGVWRETEIAEEWLPQVNIGTGTYGDLSGGRLSAESVDADYALVRNSLKARSVDMEDFTASQGFIDHAFVNLIQGKMANFDEALIGGTLLKDKAIATRHLSIADTENYLTLDALEQLSDTGIDGSSLWQSRSQGANGFTTIRNQGGMPLAIRWNGPVPENSDTSRLEFTPGGEYGMAVRPGEVISLTGYGWRASGNAGIVGVRFAFRDGDGGHVSWGDPSTGHIFQAGWRNFELTEVVPDVDSIRYMTVDFYGQPDSPRGHWGNFELRRGMAGHLIVQGLLQANTAELQELFFDTAVGNSIAAGAGRFLTIESGNLAANAVTADKISFGSLNGALITGLQIQTHTNNRGVKMTSSGIRAFNSSGSETFNVNASNGSVTADGGTFTGGTFQTSSSVFGAGGALMRQSGSSGNLVAVNSSGQVVARLGGSRNELRNLSVGQLSVDGELRVGGNGEGGIVPDGNRTRLVGRTPQTSSSEDTVAYGRTASTRFDPSKGANIYAITYEAPTSPGSRVPICGVHITASVPGYPIPLVWNTRSRSSSGFDIIVHNTGLDYSPSIWIYYIAYWGEPPNSPISTG